MIDLKHILILTIVLVVVVFIIINVIPKKIEGATTTTITNIDPTATDNYQIDTTPSKWSNINDMKNVVNKHGYTVDNWSSHIRLIIKLGCSFMIFDEKTQTWKKTYVPVLKSTPVTSQFCIIIMKRKQCNTITTYKPSYETKEISVEEIKQAKYFKIDIADYDTLMLQLTTVFQIENDKSLSEAITFSKSEGFDTIEGLEFKDVQKINGKPVLYTKQIEIRDNYKDSYTINEGDEISNLLNRFSSSGKTLGDLEYYINAMVSFDVKSEQEAAALIQFFNGQLNPRKYDYLPLEKLIAEYFNKYEITKSDILDPAATLQHGKFTTVIKKFNLQNMQLFPTTSNTDNSMLEKLNNIHDITIPTIGKDETGHYYMEDFFDAFKAHNVNPYKFFTGIYTNYKNLKIQNSTKNISDTLNAIKTFDNYNIAKAFNKLNTSLPEIGMESLDVYMTYVEIIKSVISTKTSLDFANMKDIWVEFKKYYNNHLKDIPDFKDGPIIPETIKKFFQKVEGYYYSVPQKKRKPTLFFDDMTIGYLKQFFIILNNNSMDLESLERDIQKGLTCKSFTRGHSPRVERFSAIEPESEIDAFSYINKKITKILNYISNMFSRTREGLPTFPDATILSGFGINDFSQPQLGTFEERLIELGVNDIDPNADTWTNIISFLKVMVLNGIRYNGFDEFITVMKSFGANQILDWYSVMEQTANIKIRGITNVTSFLNEITKFGIRYNSNFKEFTTNITKLNPNFYSGNLIPLTIFLTDMRRIGFTYETPEKTITTNGFISYLGKLGITFDMYSSRVKFRLQKKCPDLPRNFPSLLVNALYDYSNTRGTEYRHNMHDIKTPVLIESVPVCNMVDNIQEAYMLCKNIDEYNGKQTIIRQNVQNIIAFFYKEELDDIKAKSPKYKSMENRLSLMNEVSVGIIRFSSQFNPTDMSAYKLYTSIASFITVFPSLAFQYISNEIHIKCNNNNNDSNGECQYDIYVDPKYSFSKASTREKPFSLR
jgi:hypothetical protein